MQIWWFGVLRTSRTMLKTSDDFLTLNAVNMWSTCCCKHRGAFLTSFTEERIVTQCTFTDPPWFSQHQGVASARTCLDSSEASICLWNVTVSSVCTSRRKDCFGRKRVLGLDWLLTDESLPFASLRICHCNRLHNSFHFYFLTPTVGAVPPRKKSNFGLENVFSLVKKLGFLWERIVQSQNTSWVFFVWSDSDIRPAELILLLCSGLVACAPVHLLCATGCTSYHRVIFDKIFSGWHLCDWQTAEEVAPPVASTASSVLNKPVVNQ